MLDTVEIIHVDENYDFGKEGHISYQFVVQIKSLSVLHCINLRPILQNLCLMLKVKVRECFLFTLRFICVSK